MRLLQLSDPHLLADPQGVCRGRRPAETLARALEVAMAHHPEALLITGDLCQDESWGGYVRLRDQLDALDVQRRAPLPVALLAGNHDQLLLLRAALGRRAQLAPALVPLGPWGLVLLNSHRPGCLEGEIGARQRAWLARLLARAQGPLLVALHHPPLPIGDPGLDAIGLRDGPELLALLAAAPAVQAVVFGHVHQHWQGVLPGRPQVPLWGCPSTLCGFGPVQPCPQGRPADPGGRLLTLGPGGQLQQTLLRWSPASAPSVS